MPKSAGWDNKSFGKMVQSYITISGGLGTSISTMLASPLYFVKAGNVDWGGPWGGGGYYWSSYKGQDLSKIKALYMYSSTVGPNGEYAGYQGFSIRCISI